MRRSHSIHRSERTDQHGFLLLHSVGSATFDSTKALTA